MARLENSCLAMINNQFYRALKRIMGKCCTIQVWKALIDLPGRLTAVIAAKGASAKYCLRGVNN
jgi:hypothetical protein